MDDTTYIYAMDLAWRKMTSQKTQVVEGSLVTKVVREDRHSFEFEFVDKPGVRYTSAYPWAFVVNTPENKERYEAYRRARYEAKQAEARARELHQQVQKINIPSEGR